jgi:hypothetical protein
MAVAIIYSIYVHVIIICCNYKYNLKGPDSGV